VDSARTTVDAARSGQSRPPSRSALGVPAEPDLQAPVTVLSVRQAKGLEFDAVLVVDPDRILEESPRGRNDLHAAGGAVPR
jgi:hypothetical protein